MMEKNLFLEKVLKCKSDAMERGELQRETISILERGFCRCHIDSNQSASLLLTGINPSFKPKDEVWPEEIRDFNVQAPSGRYWLKKIKQFGEMWPQMAYMDLFPIRETSQKGIFEKTFRNANRFRADLLKIAQEEIETLAPKLIVHANRASMYYWGIKPKTRFGEDPHNYLDPWMGYKVERVEMSDDMPPCMKEHGRLERFPLYKVVGFIDSENRIKYPKETRLNYIMEYVMEYREKKDRDTLYESKDWEYILNWIQNEDRRSHSLLPNNLRKRDADRANC